MTIFLIVILVIWLLCVHAIASETSAKVKDLEKRVQTLLKRLNYYSKQKGHYVETQEEITPVVSQEYIDENFDEDTQEIVVAVDYDEQKSSIPRSGNIYSTRSSFKQISEDNIQAEHDIYEDNVEYEENNEYDNYSSKRSVVNSNTKKSNDSFENIFIGNIFIIVGAIALIIACGGFIKYVSSFIEFTPLIKTLIGMFAGVTVLTIGCKGQDDERLKMYSETLIGTGFAILFVTTFCTTVLFKTFSLPVCGMIGILILMAAYYFADKKKTLSMIAISLIGGYLNVFFLSFDVSVGVLTSYLLFLNLLSIIFVLRNPDKSIINPINLVVSALFATIAYSNEHNLQNNNIIFPVLLWVGYLSYEIYLSIKEKDYSCHSNFLGRLNFIILLFLSYILFYDSKFNLGILFLLVSIVYNIIVCLFIFKDTDKFKPYLFNMLASILFSIYFISSGVVRIALWDFIAIILAFVIYKYNREYLQKWLLTYLSCSFLNLLFIKGVCYTPSTLVYNPVINERLYAFIAPVSAFYVSFFFLNKMNEKSSKNLAQFLKLCFVSLIYLFISFELNDFINLKMNMTNDSNIFVKSMLYSIVGFTYAIQIKYYQNVTKNELYSIISTVAALLAFMPILFVPFVALTFKGSFYVPIENFVPVINIRFFAFIYAIATYTLFYRWSKSSLYLYLTLMLGFVLITFEGYDVIFKSNSVLADNSFAFALNNSYLISLIWILYVGIITTIGIFKNSKPFKISGILFSILTVAKIVIFDIAKLDDGYKIIVWVTLGFILLVTSYLYNKRK